MQNRLRLDMKSGLRRQAQSYEAKLTELHSVIAELKKQLEVKRETVIQEEEEEFEGSESNCNCNGNDHQDQDQSTPIITGKSIPRSEKYLFPQMCLESMINPQITVMCSTKTVWASVTVPTNRSRQWRSN